MRYGRFADIVIYILVSHALHQAYFEKCECDFFSSSNQHSKKVLGSNLATDWSFICLNVDRSFDPLTLCSSDTPPEHFP